MSDSPRAVFERFLTASLDSDLGKLADFYAEDVVIEMPFAPEGVPKRSEGREPLRARLSSFAGRRPWTFDKIDSVVVHETTDPEVIIAEYDIHATVIATGEPLVLSYVMVITVRDGLIVHSRDYSNSLAILNARQGPAPVAESLRQESA